MAQDTKIANKMSFQLKKVLISDEIDSRCVEVLHENGVEVVKDTKLRLTKDNFLKEIAVSVMISLRVFTSAVDWLGMKATAICTGSVQCTLMI